MTTIHESAKGQKTETMAPCPGCSSKRGYRVAPQVHICAGCDGIVGSCYLGDSYLYVLPQMTAAAVPAEATRYYDFTTLGSKGVGRRHGWYDPTTKLITQVG